MKGITERVDAKVSSFNPVRRAHTTQDHAKYNKIVPRDALTSHLNPPLHADSSVVLNTGPGVGHLLPAIHS